MQLTKCLLCHQPMPHSEINICKSCGAPLKISRRSVVKTLAGLFVAGGTMSLLEACAGNVARTPAQSSASPPSVARSRLLHPKLGTTLLTYYGQPYFKADPIAWAPDGKRIASGYIAGSLSVMQVWDAATGHTLLSCRHGENVFGVAWSPDGTRVASGGGDNLVRVWNAVQGDATTIGTTLLIYKGHTDSVVGVAWSPDGKRIASGSDDTTVQVWNSSASGSGIIPDYSVETMARSLLTYRGHAGSVIAVPWSPDGTRIASGSVDATIQVWDATTGKTLLVYKGHSGPIFGVAWSPDGARIASASRDRTVQVWDAKSGKTLLTYRGHIAPVTDVKWSPDGTRIVTSSGDTTVQVWNSTTGDRLFTYKGHTDVVFDVGWSPDGTRIASASADTTVKVWQAE